MNPHALVILDAPRGGGSHLQRRVEPCRGHREPLVADDIAALDCSFFGAAEVQRDSLSPSRRLHSFVVDLNASHAKRLITRQAPHPFAQVHVAGLRRARDNKAMSREGEYSINGKSEVS